MVEHPPDCSLALEDGIEQKEGINGVVRGLKRASHIDGHVRARAGVQEHHVMEVVAIEEEGLKRSRVSEKIITRRDGFYRTNLADYAFIGLS